MEYRLTDLCELIMGQSPDSSSCNKDGKGIPFYQGNADFGEKNPTPRNWCLQPKKIAQKDDILISVRAPIGDLNIANEDCCIGRGVAAIRMKSKECDRDYLYLFLESKSKYLQDCGTGSTFTAINKGVLESLKVKCPELKNQTSIANEIENIKAAIKYKNSELICLNEAVQSEFVEMFGEGSCKQIPFSEYAEIIDGDRGKNYPKSEDFSDDDYCLFLSAKNVTKNGFLFENNQFISKEKDEILRKGKLNRGDIVITTRGTIGNIAYFDDSIPYENIRINSGMVIIRNKDLEFNQRFFLEAFRNKIDEIIATQVTGAAQPQLPIHIMSKITLPYPDLPLQNKFAAFVEQIDKSKFVLQQQLQFIKKYDIMTSWRKICFYTTVAM